MLGVVGVGGGFLGLRFTRTTSGTWCSLFPTSETSSLASLLGEGFAWQNEIKQKRHKTALLDMTAYLDFEIWNDLYSKISRLFMKENDHTSFNC